ncbi:MAG: phosphonate metabolism transcriptional regulator PhnF [Alphaproteobacteria bacterium]|nr:phosphonate metabolism transcriptional regulator PhnF [Alphaproteobacteria bacterium]
MSLERKSGSSLWHQIEETLTAEIASGSLKSGDRLPAEPELMDRFEVSRFTVRRAMANLEQKGLIRVEQGRGTFVHDNVVKYAISSRTRHSKNLIEQGYEPGFKLIEEEELKATKDIAHALRIPEGARILHRRNLNMADDTVIAIGSSYFPLDRFPDIAEVRRSHATTTATYAHYGIRDYVRLYTQIEARLPTPAEARLLEQPRSLPIVLVTKIDGDSANVPISYAQTTWAADRVVFTIEQPPK